MRNMKLSKNAIQWLASGDRGVSSNTIFETITGINTGEKHQDYPHDPADFRECLRLLDVCPEFKPMFGKMKDISPI